MSASNVRAARVVDLIRELSIDPAGPEQPPVTPATSLADVGFDPLAFAELALALEREFDLDLDAAVLDEHGVYPEGTRAPGRLLPFLHGAAWLALRTGVPLVPVGVAGTAAPLRAMVPRRANVRITFGEPLLVRPVEGSSARRSGSVRLTEELGARIAELLRGLRTASGLRTADVNPARRRVPETDGPAGRAAAAGSG